MTEQIQKPDGGAAFPRLYARSDDDGNSGMTLRDWFAGLAFQAKLSNPELTRRGRFPKNEEARRILKMQANEKRARDAYEKADAMIAERNKL